MEVLQQFVQAENIRLHAEHFCSELDPQKRTLFKSLLIEEEDKFAFQASHFDLAQQHIADGVARIKKQRKLISHMQANGQDTRVAETLLSNLMATLNSFLDFSERVHQELSKFPTENP